MTEVFRLSSAKYAKTLSGRGSARLGARWNSAGVELVYTASNRSLAMAEVAVHLSLSDVPDDLIMATIQLPDGISIHSLREDELPADWNTFPHPQESQEIGDRFVIQQKHCVLRVPSAVTRGDYNFLLNPNHQEFKRIKIVGAEAFPVDKRMFR